MYSTGDTTSHQVRAAAAVGSTCRPPRHVRHHALPPTARRVTRGGWRLAGQCKEEEEEEEGLAVLPLYPLACADGGGAAPHPQYRMGCPCGAEVATAEVHEIHMMGCSM